MGPDRIVMPSPAFDDDLSLLQGGEDLAIQQLVSEPTSVTPMERIASVTRVPCATRTSTWRSLETISSGVCLFLRIAILLWLSRARLQGGPLHWGRIKPGVWHFHVGSSGLCREVKTMDSECRHNRAHDQNEPQLVVVAHAPLLRPTSY